ncbi:MAG: exopolysaccharide biosynthesis polyprenyl glycosylphosphotransferase [Caulobacteraceae bacterium]
MVAAARKHALSDAERSTAPVAEGARAARPAAPDAEAFAAEIGPRSDRRGARERRGPLRPERLLSPRARLNGLGPARAFRIADGCIVGALATLFCAAAQPGGLLAAPVGAVLPYLIGAVLVIWSLDAAGAYRFGAHEPLSAHLLRTGAAFLAPVAVLAIGGGLFGLSRTNALHGLICIGVPFAAIYLAHVWWWMTVRRWRADGRLTPNIVVVGATKNAERLIQGLLQTREAHVLGVFDDRLDRAPGAIHGVPVLGDTQALISHRITPYVDRIVVTVPPAAQGRVRQIIERLRVLPNDISLFLDFDGESQGAAALSRLANAPLAQLSGAPRNETRAFWKRGQDLVVGSLALLAALPVMAAVALAIRLDSKGPILFRQRRHGFNNEEIVVWKFRSMRTDDAEAAGARQVSVGDERVTRVGRFIRRTSLDELPQLLNVLQGEMSLVGPRPHPIGMKTGETESARLVAEYAHRHRLKPGMTGWAAIHGSRGPVDTPESVRRRVALDVEYIDRQSFWLDLYILVMTIPCLIGDRANVR